MESLPCVLSRDDHFVQNLGLADTCPSFMSDPSSTELRHLLNLVAAGNDQGVKELYMHYSNTVRDFIRSQVWDESVVDEILNDTFLVVCKKPLDFNHTSKFSTWLCGIAKNKALDWKRKQMRHRDDVSGDDELEKIEAPDWNLLERIEDDEKHHFLRECLKALPIKQRDVLRMVFDQELPLADIANLLGVPVGTAKTRAMHARIKIADCVHSKYAGRVS